MFSLGACILEICSEEQLPANGPRWQAIRNGEIRSLLEKVSLKLFKLIQTMLLPDPIDRPNASKVLLEIK